MTGGEGRRDNARPSRRSLRLATYDYSQAGAYFVTICTQERACLFGHIEEGQMWQSPAGDMVRAVWNELPQYYPRIEIDAFVVMPNHVHGIILLIDVGAGPRACPMDDPDNDPSPSHDRLSLTDVLQRFKSLTTYRYGEGVSQRLWPAYPGRLWQRNYYEHVIRHDAELDKIREYILQNPLKWETDRENLGI